MKEQKKQVSFDKEKLMRWSRCWCS